jgi:acyl-CoA reductase-like NAD-dependent aldehyde dehydrogenase
VSFVALQERGKIIWKFAELIEQHADELAKLETLDNGKPYTIARGVDIPHVVKHFQYFAGDLCTSVFLKICLEFTLDFYARSS